MLALFYYLCTQNYDAMKILHCADLHLGQILYQNYDRVDEHAHFFRQLAGWCRQYAPDALLVSGDVFDIQQPSASVKKFFTDTFVELHRQCPDMSIIIIAGNHDSASRLQADAEVWKCVGVHIFGMAPSTDLLAQPNGWQEQYIVRLDSGYVVAMPYAAGTRRALAQALLDYVNAQNSANLPVVLTGHLAVNTADVTGHSFEIGKIATQTQDDLGHGYDYAALGHIHRPQTLGFPLADESSDESTYPSGIARYSGSALHVSCDEKYPHTVSLVEMAEHGSDVHVQRLRIEELRHFYELPMDGTAANSSEEAIAFVQQFVDQGNTGYIRLRLPYSASIPPDFDQLIYKILDGMEDKVRYNPKSIWVGEPAQSDAPKPVFEVAELQEMTNPMDFIEKTISQFPNLSLDELRQDFEEVEAEIRHMMEEEKAKKGTKIEEN
jgi:exonuclease SbcD